MDSGYDFRYLIRTSAKTYVCSERYIYMSDEHYYRKILIKNNLKLP